MSECVGLVDQRGLLNCTACGYHHLPGSREVDPGKFYAKKFWYERPQHRAEFEAARGWWETTYSEWLQVVDGPLSGNLLDIGCGYGEFLRVADQLGYTVEGVEPGDEAFKHAFGLPVETLTLHHVPWTTAFIPRLQPAVVSALWLLEHLPRPNEFLAWVRATLPLGGRLLVVVPADYNPRQLAMPVDRHWVHPTHLNYWTVDEIRATVERAGFGVVDVLGTFPVDAFLAAGLDYRSDPGIGAALHRGIREFESALSRHSRLELHRELARRNACRDTVVVAEKHG